MLVNTNSKKVKSPNTISGRGLRSVATVYIIAVRFKAFMHQLNLLPQNGTIYVVKRLAKQMKYTVKDLRVDFPDITIATDPKTSYAKIYDAVSLPTWNTHMRRNVQCIDIYQQTPESKKQTTLQLTITRLDRQPSNEDMGFWLLRIANELDGWGAFPDAATVRKHWIWIKK